VKKKPNYFQLKVANANPE
jgi:hypothetical protein